jgi:flagellar assembly protein FliH
MSLEANQYPVKKIQQAATPLMFRNIEEFADFLSPVLDEAVEAASTGNSEVFDFESSLRAAHEQGRAEAMNSAQDHIQQQLQQERDSMSRFVQQFQEEKQRYFSEVEAEVVKLSLAIAERVLHREAEMDPMLLAGAARVALDQVADSSEAVLRVSADDVHRWSEVLKPAARGMVIEADEDLPRGECILKTRSGTVQLGLRAQLQEIEKGFFELLGRRPSMAT